MRTEKRLNVHLFLVCLLIVFSFSSAYAKDYAGVAEKIDSLLADPELKHGIQGVLVESLTDGTVLYERNSRLVFIPASNFKLLVSAAALDRLGPNFRYKTTLYQSGEINKQEELNGDLVLCGGGDPTLKPEHLENFVKSVKDKGIKKINGDIVVDESRFDDQRLGWGWSWDDEPYYYSAQVSALCLNWNVVNVYVKPGKQPGDRAIVTLDPDTDYMSVVNTAVTGIEKSEKTVSVDRVRGRNIIRVSGNIPLNYRSEGPEEPITVEEPAIFAGRIFKQQLEAAGITVSGRVRPAKVPDKATVLGVHTSSPLSEIIALLNKPSDNLIAEVLLRTLGAEIKGKGTIENGAAVETEFLRSAGLDIDALRIADGSGLSRQNYVSPANLVALLKHMYRHTHSRIYLDPLPVAGVDGTLRRRMKGTPAEGNVRAKTGYVSRVSSLSGYLTTKGGDPLVFSIMMNSHLCPNSSATKVQNSICEYLAGLE